MEKKIHYCWFGGKPLPKLAKRCIKSWKKFLPEYEIIEWNEKNSDINDCAFVKEAYENKKWAFVSDYIRTKVLYDYGGIYFDTDMKVIKNIDNLMKNDIFFGKEDNGYIAAGVIGVKEKHNKYIKEMLEFYESQAGFDMSDLFKYAIPKVITKILSKYNKKVLPNKIEIYDESAVIYPNEYFYPINYDYSEKVFTNNTCMIHYYNATWVSNREKMILKLNRIFGKWMVQKMLNLLRKIKLASSIYFGKKRRIIKIAERLKSNNNDYIAIHNPDWFGVSNSTKDLFNSTFEIRDVYTDKEAGMIADLLSSSNKKMLIFSGMAKRWSLIIKKIREQNKDIIIKVLWHGSNALLVEYLDYKEFMDVLEMLDNKVINEIGFVKKSLYEFFKQKGYNVSCVMNTTNIDIKELGIIKTNKNDGKVRIGLYSSLDRWIKNTYNQVSAASLFENAILDCVPMSQKVSKFADALKLNYTSVSTNIPREELLKRMSQNDINLYVTFTECSPMIPLESLELGVPCITGDNHHYFTGTSLEKFLIVNKEDDINEIYNKAKLCIENREEIIRLYKEWKKEYDIIARRSVELFLK